MQQVQKVQRCPANRLPRQQNDLRAVPALSAQFKAAFEVILNDLHVVQNTKMTKPASPTQAQVRRVIQAARREGLGIAGIKPDGTIIVYDGVENPLVSVDHPALPPDDADARRWGDDVE
jgi:hypothetical protein